MRILTVLGSTGSIGTQTLDVVRAHPGRLQVVALAGGHNVKRLLDQAREFRPEAVAVLGAEEAQDLRSALPASTQVLWGRESMSELAAWETADTTVVGISGAASLEPTLAAIRARKRVAFAAKEALVAAGDILVAEAERLAVPLLPVDSEISALFQCLQGEDVSTVKRILLTASGGPFRRSSKEELARVSPEAALAHPTWTMGAKITIDSATMMNKGLEVLEAWRLFRVPLERIEILVHPQSIVHSMIEFADGSVKAQLACPDMRPPIQYAVMYPERPSNPFDRLNLLKAPSLTFEPPDPERFPCIGLAYEAGRVGGTMTAVLSAANEAAVAAFLEERIGFLDIPRLVEHAMGRHSVVGAPGLGTILEADIWARSIVQGALQ